MRRTIFKVPEAAFRAEDEESPHSAVRRDRRSAHPPHERVAEEVDLAVVLDPEILY